MGGSAILDPTKLVDALVPTVDSLRDNLHGAFGVRPFRVFAVRRLWSSGYAGVGVASDTEVEITPTPKVSRWDGLKWELAATGIEELGEIMLSELSLTYTEAELTGGTLNPGEQWLIRLQEGHGQGTQSRLFAVSRPPFPDREKTVGWVVYLARATLAGFGPLAPFRTYRTFLSRLVWSQRIGVGEPTLIEHEIEPSPFLASIDLKGRLRAAGLEEEETVLMTGIPRGIPETELFSPPDVDSATTKFLYHVIGTDPADGIRDRWYVPADPPVLNAGGTGSFSGGVREGDMMGHGWTVRLRRVEDPL